MKSLINDYWAYTEESRELDDDLSKVIKPIFNKFIEKGFNAREISHYMMIVISAIESEIVLRRAMQKRKSAVKKALDDETDDHQARLFELLDSLPETDE